MMLYVWMIVQIIGESLPISSSGHVQLAHNIMARFFDVSMMSYATLWAFDYLLQGVSAVVFFCYFFSIWWRLIIKQPIGIGPLCDLIVWKNRILPVIFFGIVADGVTFLFWGCKITDVLYLPLWAGFMITAAALWSMQYTHEKKDIQIWSLYYALIVGLVQGCALMQGVSRFATTVAALQWCGYPGTMACAVSFLLQWPLIVAASVYGWCHRVGVPGMETMLTVPAVFVMAGAGIVGYAMIGCMYRMIDRKIIWKLSYYMIIPIVGALLI